MRQNSALPSTVPRTAGGPLCRVQPEVPAFYCRGLSSRDWGALRTADQNSISSIRPFRSFSGSVR